METFTFAWMGKVILLGTSYSSSITAPGASLPRKQEARYYPNHEGKNVSSMTLRVIIITLSCSIVQVSRDERRRSGRGALQGALRWEIRLVYPPSKTNRELLHEPHVAKGAL